MVFFFSIIPKIILFSKNCPYTKNNFPFLTSIVLFSLFFSLDRGESHFILVYCFFIFSFFPFFAVRTVEKSLWCGLCYALLFKNDKHYIRKGIQTMHYCQSHHMGLHQIRTSHARALFTHIHRYLALLLPDSLCFRYFPTTAWPFPLIHPLKTAPSRGQPYPIPLE